MKILCTDSSDSSEILRNNLRNLCCRSSSFMPPQRRHADARRQTVRGLRGQK
jgi:hypothetical protein